MLKLSELYENKQIDKKIYTGISKIIDKMKRDGLVEKIRAGQQILVALTDMGKSAVEFLNQSTGMQ